MRLALIRDQQLGTICATVMSECSHVVVTLLLYLHAPQLALLAGSDPFFVFCLPALVGSKPYQPSWGNFGEDSGGECGVMTQQRFLMPRADAGSEPPFWYGFRHGPLHFIVLSTEHDLSQGSVQYRWLEKEFKVRVAGAGCARFMRFPGYQPPRWHAVYALYRQS